ncbi:hypothetical protein T05_10587 [Trichinella murrelli]|uniref:Uncharacterized protein n=1 Tax=Trichinella murrelli TaxID=144512 RepID=A0A0V0U4F0_9BILA|nr:hypothetical protein T05_10587 [Trichinella murrelli]
MKRLHKCSRINDETKQDNRFGGLLINFSSRCNSILVTLFNLIDDVEQTTTTTTMMRNVCCLKVEQEKKTNEQPELKMQITSPRRFYSSIEEKKNLCRGKPVLSMCDDEVNFSKEAGPTDRVNENDADQRITNVCPLKKKKKKQGLVGIDCSKCE